nr:type II toxin-antitoxin system RelE/ParE family toxin [Candidatus Njordarchaeum guaymaensis]
MKAKFKLEFTPRFERRFKSLDGQVQRRVFREIKILQENPHAGKMLRGSWTKVYSLRVGDYRVLYLIAEDKVVLLSVGHRKRVYQSMI